MNSREAGQVQIEHELEDFGFGLQTLEAKTDGVHSGALSYYWSKGGEAWEISNILVNVNFRGMGIGKALLKKFVERVGPNQPVYCAVIHPATIEASLRKYQEANVLGKYMIPEDEFIEIPFSRILNSGGIEVRRISVMPNVLDPEEPPFEVEMWGRTRQNPQP